MAQRTYYFDASVSGPTDDESAWTNDSNAFDENVSTFATCSQAGNTGLRELNGQGTTAPSSGVEIREVRVRLYAQNGSASPTAAVYRGFRTEYLGIAVASASGWGPWTQLKTPSVGWSWTVLQNLTAAIYNTYDSADGVSRVEIEVTLPSKKINNFWGAETNGFEECLATAGSVSVSSAQAKSGTYSYRIPNSTNTYIDFAPLESVPQAGSGIVFGAGVYTTGSGLCIFAVLDSSDTVIIRVTSSTLPSTQVYEAGDSGADSQPAGITASTWNWIEVYFENVGSSANWKVYVNGNEVSSGTVGDFSGTIAKLRIWSSNADVWFDDIYFMSGCSSADDRLGDCEVYSYRSNLNSATGDFGSALTTGTWLAVQTVPFSASVGATYDGGPIFGGIYTNDVGGSAGTGGPYTDTNINGTVVAQKGTWKAERGNGGGTDHYGLIGDNLYGVIRTRDFDLATSAANYTHVMHGGSWSLSAAGIISGTMTGASDFFFNTDGTKVFRTTGTVVQEYPLSTAWDISSRGSLTDSFDMAAAILSQFGDTANALTGMDSNSSGTRIYMWDQATAYYYGINLSTAWDLTTASINTGRYSLANYTSARLATADSNPGTSGTDYLYMVETGGTICRRYRFNTVDVITASLVYQPAADSPNLVPGYGEWTNTCGIEISPDGRYLFVGVTNTSSPYQTAILRYTMSTPYDPSTVGSNYEIWSYGTNSNAGGIRFKPDGTKFFGQSIAASTCYQMEVDKLIPDLSLGNVYSAVGFEMSNAQDFECYDMLATVLHVPAQNASLMPVGSIPRARAVRLAR